jgi:hypothetical protein
MGKQLRLRSISWLPKFRPDLASLGFQKCAAAIQAMAMPEVQAAPKIVPTNIMPTASTTMLPAYSVAKIPFPAPVFQVGPWWWTVLDIKDAAPCKLTPRKDQGASIAIYSIIL